MKKFLLLIILITSSISSYAFKTTVSTFIYKDTTSILPVNYSYSPLQTGMRRVQFLNHTTGIPELETALDEASKIFTKAMAQEGIDLVNITAEVLTEDLGPDSSVLCKVEIIYTDTVYYNSNYPEFKGYDNYDDEVFRILVPQAITNQSKGENEGLAMRIKLRPNAPYYCDVAPNQDWSYDAITILLRALAMGCGLQSTFNPTTSNLGYPEDEIIYVNAFDTQIHNEDGVAFVNVAGGNHMISANTFFTGKQIYANGRLGVFEPEIPIYLFNERLTDLTATYTDLTVNTISPENYTEEDTINDLLDAYLPYEMSIREVTPYTMALLRSLGWRYTFAVGNEDLYADLHASKLQCNNTVLSPNSTYTVSLNKNNVFLENNLRCELISKDSVYNIGTFTPNYTSYSFSYSNIPSNIQWRRNPATKNIVAQITGTAGMFVDQYMTQTKICDIEIPYHPNMPIVQRSETAANGNVTLDLSVFANGSNTYTLTYIGLADSVSHTETITANSIDTIISLPATQLYDFSIYGTNAQGNSASYNFTMGASVVPEIFLNVMIRGSVLRYYLDSSHSPNLPCVNIGSFFIKNSMGNTFITSNADPGDAIDISSLSRGYYIFSVIVNGQTYSKVFYKR